ncbi:MAG: hypothetical protein KF700_04735 [Hyphomonadaceae bacterium]|nr:hypothetical protein [Hyphomonadaceae bacterium]
MARDARALISTTEGRDRVSCVSAFVLIFAFAITSFDYLLVGGPDWTPGPAQAQAAELPGGALHTPAAFVPAAAPLENLPPIGAPAVDPALELAAYTPGIGAEQLLGGPNAMPIQQVSLGGASFQPASFPAPDTPPVLKAPALAPLAGKPAASASETASLW